MLAEQDMQILRELLLEFHQDIRDLFNGYENTFKYFVDSSSPETVAETILALDRLLLQGLSDDALRDFALDYLCSGLPSGSAYLIFENVRGYIAGYAQKRRETYS